MRFDSSCFQTWSELIAIRIIDDARRNQWQRLCVSDITTMETTSRDRSGP